jgi:hypothetical protein
MRRFILSITVIAGSVVVFSVSADAFVVGNASSVKARSDIVSIKNSWGGTGNGTTSAASKAPSNRGTSNRDGTKGPGDWD